MALVEAGTPVGILAHAEGKTVGWCSVAPRETYRKMSRQQDDTEACYRRLEHHRFRATGTAWRQ